MRARPCWTRSQRSCGTSKTGPALAGSSRRRRFRAQTILRTPSKALAETIASPSTTPRAASFARHRTSSGARCRDRWTSSKQRARTPHRASRRSRPPSFPASRRSCSTSSLLSQVPKWPSPSGSSPATRLTKSSWRGSMTPTTRTARLTSSRTTSTTSTTMSTSSHELAECGCSVGQFGDGEAACDSCPLGTTSYHGSLVVGDCFCSPGYTADSDGVECAACALGHFKPVAGAGNCSPCMAQWYGD
mmetsp:Transcript_54425/g.129309  ORF Transcript_54425/g.129309 Transcript_54425/m.129309 type:complete len:246 (+) Transcript_54425:135-872(+)